MRDTEHLFFRRERIKHMAVLYMDLPGMVDYDFTLKRYLAKQVT